MTVSSIPRLLRIQPQHLAREHGRVRRDVCGREVLGGLHGVEDPEELRLDEVDEDEVDGGVVGDGGRVGGDEVGGVEEGLLRRWVSFVVKSVR